MDKILDHPTSRNLRKKIFNKEHHEKYLKHEKIENLAGLEIDMVYEWSVYAYFDELDYIAHPQ